MSGLKLRVDQGESFEVPFDLITHPKLSLQEIGDLVCLMGLIAEGADEYEIPERGETLPDNLREMGIVSAEVKGGALKIHIDLTKGRE